MMSSSSPSYGHSAISDLGDYAAVFGRRPEGTRERAETSRPAPKYRHGTFPSMYLPSWIPDRHLPAESRTSARPPPPLVAPSPRIRYVLDRNIGPREELPGVWLPLEPEEEYQIKNDKYDPTR